MASNNCKRPWNRAGIPHKGWRCIHVTDLVEATPEAVCEMCGQESLRFVHTMRHSDYSDDLEVGCICASKMEADSNAPKARERRLSNLAKRRHNWLARKWRVSRKGNPFLNVEGHRVTIFPDKYQTGQWQCSIAANGNEPTFSRARFATIDDAKLAAFDELAARLHWK